VAEELLGSSYVVEELAPTTRSRADLALFRLSAWTDNIELIPSVRTLVIPKPEVVDERSSVLTLHHREEVSTLRYRVLIHVDSVEDDGAGQVRSSSSGGDRRDLHPHGPPGAGGRRRRELRWQLGVPDRRGGGGDPGSTAVRRSYRQALMAPLHWALLPMDSQMERHVAPVEERPQTAVERTGQDSNHRPARHETRKTGVFGRSAATGHVVVKNKPPSAFSTSSQQVWVRKALSKELLTATEMVSEKAPVVLPNGAGGGPSILQLAETVSAGPATTLDRGTVGSYEVEEDRDAAIH
jgi:hypothetical protein